MASMPFPFAKSPTVDADAAAPPRGAGQSALGTCAHGTCRGGLEYGANTVRCSVCGTPVPDHPLMLEKARQEKAVRPAVVIPPADYTASDRDRIKAAEERILKLEAAVNDLLKRAPAGKR